MNANTEIKLIAEIFTSTDTRKLESYKTRHASRGILFNAEGKIAVMNVRNMGYHKLPGGGVEFGEDVKETLRRELLEEVGASISDDNKDIVEIGKTIEYRNNWGFSQISHVYKCDVVGEIGAPKLDEGEAVAGFVTEWHDIVTAIKLIKTPNFIGNTVADIHSDAEAKYAMYFMTTRDAKILEFYKENFM